MANVSSSKEATTTTPRGPIRARSGRGFSLSGLVEYLQGVREELRKATWPTRAELVRLTQIVLLAIAIVAAYVGGLDALLSWITRRFGFGI